MRSMNSLNRKRLIPGQHYRGYQKTHLSGLIDIQPSEKVSDLEKEFKGTLWVVYTNSM